MTPPKHICIRDEQIQGMSRKIERLDAHGNFKDKRMDEIVDKQTVIENKIDNLTQMMNDMKIQNVNADTLIKEYINELENRVTQLETAQNTTYKLIMFNITLIPIIITIIELLLQF